MMEAKKYNTLLFKDVFDSSEQFVNEYKSSALYVEELTNNSINVTYYLLYAKHGNDPITNLDVEQWKYRCWQLMYEFAPTWQKKTELQTALRGLSLDEILIGSTAVSNHAENPQMAPGTSTLDELEYINSQNSIRYKKSKIEAYSQLQEMLKTNYTEEYINKFKKIFKLCVTEERPTLYFSENDY